MANKKNKKEDVAIITDLKMGDITPEPDKKDKTKQNWIINAKNNIKIIKSSPYASLQFAYKIRIIIVVVLIAYIAYMGFGMVRDYHADGFMNTVGRVMIAGVLGFVCWSIYKTIPQAKKQIEYYKKYPHLINYCPTDTRETVDSIFKKIEENKKKLAETKK